MASPVAFDAASGGQRAAGAQPPKAASRIGGFESPATPPAPPPPRPPALQRRPAKAVRCKRPMHNENMFGGIAAGPAGDRIHLATSDGHVVTLLVETGEVRGEFTLHPSAPVHVGITACAVDRDGTLLLADRLHKTVRRFALDGRALGRFGVRATPGIAIEDRPGVLDDPCALLPLDGGLLVGCGGAAMQHGVQRFDREGAYVDSLVGPAAEWRSVLGLALVEDEIWVSESGANALRRFSGTSFLGNVALHGELRRPFRIAADGFGGALLLLAPETEEEQAACGIARISRDGAFRGWLVEAGERGGHVEFPFDLAVLPDGRFVAADLPLGTPPDVRLQLFGPDGRHLGTLLDDAVALVEKQTAWFSRVARDGSPYERARVHHYHGGGEPGHLGEAERLYRNALSSEPTAILPRLGLATLLQGALARPEEAEGEYLEAIRHGGDRGDLLARVAECRRARGELDGAIAVLQGAVEGDHPPEEYHRLLDLLGTYYLERAGESPETMI